MPPPAKPSGKDQNFLVTLKNIRRPRKSYCEVATTGPIVHRRAGPEQANLGRLLVEDIPHADGRFELVADFLGDRRIVIPGGRHLHVDAIVTIDRNVGRVSVDVGVEEVVAQRPAVIGPELLVVAGAAENFGAPEGGPAARHAPGQPEVADPSPGAGPRPAVDVDDAEQILRLIREQREILLERPAHVREEAELTSPPSRCWTSPVTSIPFVFWSAMLMYLSLIVADLARVRRARTEHALTASQNGLGKSADRVTLLEDRPCAELRNFALNLDVEIIDGEAELRVRQEGRSSASG